MAEQRRYSKFEVHKIMLISWDKPNEVVIINFNFSKKFVPVRYYGDLIRMGPVSSYFSYNVI